MITIYKYEITDTLQVLDVPQNSEVLSCQLVPHRMKGYVPCIWMRVYSTNAREKRVFVLFNTGEEMPFKAYRFIATLQFPNGTVQHLFEVVPTENKE